MACAWACPAPGIGHRSHSLAVTASSLSGDLLMPFALNACWQPLNFGLPTLPAHHRSGWLRIIDTARPSPRDLVELAEAKRAIGAKHRVEPRSVAVMFAPLR